jgi:hypothetical protein
MPYKWTEKAPEGELFEDAYGTCGKTRIACDCCYGTGVDYDETCVGCGGLGWVVENEECP